MQETPGNRPYWVFFMLFVVSLLEELDEVPSGLFWSDCFTSELRVVVVLSVVLGAGVGAGDDVAGGVVTSTLGVVAGVC